MTPASSATRNLCCGQIIVSMDRDYIGNVQFSAEEHCRVTAGQRIVGVEQIYGLGPMQLSDSTDDMRKKECALHRSAHGSGQRKINDPLARIDEIITPCPTPMDRSHSQDGVAHAQFRQPIERFGDEAAYCVVTRKLCQRYNVQYETLLFFPESAGGLTQKTPYFANTQVPHASTPKCGLLDLATDAQNLSGDDLCRLSGGANLDSCDPDTLLFSMTRFFRVSIRIATRSIH